MSRRLPLPARTAGRSPECRGRRGSSVARGLTRPVFAPETHITRSDVTSFSDTTWRLTERPRRPPSSSTSTSRLPFPCAQTARLTLLLTNLTSSSRPSATSSLVFAVAAVSRVMVLRRKPLRLNNALERERN